MSSSDFTELYNDSLREVARTTEIAERCNFNLSQLVYRYPSELLPEGYTSSTWLRHLTLEGAETIFGGRLSSELLQQIHKELDLIDELDYCGYFLTMWDIVQFCRNAGILCQGRGSAANSIVCRCLGITAIDPMRLDMLFERFLSRERAEPPDIDLDIEHRRREEVIQHMYQKYGRSHAAMVANVVRYRTRSAVREVGKVLGIPATTLDMLSKLVSHHDSILEGALSDAHIEISRRRISLLVDLVHQILDFPRHLSIHPGGFLLGTEPVSHLVPVENATMPDRTVIQWDKYDVEELGLFKVDLLGLGALTQMHFAFDLLQEHMNRSYSMGTIPQDDPAVFEMLKRADTVGVFQVESRAQMAMLPRLKPKNYYDIVIEISIVRPGPISGGMVHPYLRRRDGIESPSYPHPSLEPVLRKTLGVPLFQEQVMRLAVVAADYTPGEADQLRRDMAAWKRSGRIEEHREKMIRGMIAKGIERKFTEQVFEQIRGFGEYGFPESHAASFAIIAYATAWLKCRYPTVFTCSLLNAWPMGFYSPATIIQDAKRHGIEFMPVDILSSSWECRLVPKGNNNSSHSSAMKDPDRNPEDKKFCIRMGLRFVRGMGENDYERIVKARSRGLTNLETFVNASRLSEDVLINLSQAGAFQSFGVSRRSAFWQALGKRGETMDGPESNPAEGNWLVSVEETIPEFTLLNDVQTISWDHLFTGHSTRGHPLEPYRAELKDHGLPDAWTLQGFKDGQDASYAGLVICRQRPGTASGVLFITLEDETGFVNCIVWPKKFEEYRPVILTTTFLGVSGKIQAEQSVVYLIVESVWRPSIRFTPKQETNSSKNYSEKNPSNQTAGNQAGQNVDNVGNLSNLPWSSHDFR